MRVVETDEFLQWAGERGLGLDERYNEPRCLVYKPDRDVWRFWGVPRSPRACTEFFGCLLDGAGPWASCRLWFRGGRWPDQVKHDHTESNEEVRAAVLRSFGIASLSPGAIELDRSERDQILTIAFLQTAFGWMSYDDLFIVPDHAHSFLWLDHHGVVHVEFQHERIMNPFILHMQTHGHALPTRPPDATFKRPRWMKEPRSDPDQAG